MMNKTLILLLVFCKMGFAQEGKYLSPHYEFKTGEIAYMFGNNVKLRTQPNTDAKVSQLLRIGDQIEIVEKTDSSMVFDGMDSPWYKVKVNDEIGYVLGGLIALDKAVNGNATYLVALKKEDSNLFLKTRVIENGSTDFVENISLLFTEEFSIKATTNKGLENVKSIFEVDYLSEACGVNGGGIYLFYNGTDLLKAIDYSQVVDGDVYFFQEEYIFPSESGGVQGKIVYKCETSEKLDDETEWVESKTIRRLLEWNGQEVIPKFKKEEN